MVVKFPESKTESLSERAKLNVKHGRSMTKRSTWLLPYVKMEFSIGISKKVATRRLSRTNSCSIL